MRCGDHATIWLWLWLDCWRSTLAPQREMMPFPDEKNTAFVGQILVLCPQPSSPKRPCDYFYPPYLVVLCRCGGFELRPQCLHNKRFIHSLLPNTVLSLITFLSNFTQNKCNSVCGSPGPPITLKSLRLPASSTSPFWLRLLPLLPLASGQRLSSLGLPTSMSSLAHSGSACCFLPSPLHVRVWPTSTLVLLCSTPLSQRC